MFVAVLVQVHRAQIQMAVLFDKRLANVMSRHYSPEHCGIHWRGVAQACKLLRIRYGHDNQVVFYIIVSNIRCNLSLRHPL